jgi:ketosteroid isomerase-like protein
MVRLIARAPLLSVIVLLAGNGTSYAQQSDIDSVKAAVAAYHAAIGSLDMSKMDPLWAHDAYVTAIQPRDKTISIGWDAVKKGWETLPNVWSELKITHRRMDLIFTSMAMWHGRWESRTP